MGVCGRRSALVLLACLLAMYVCLLLQGAYVFDVDFLDGQLSLDIHTDYVVDVPCTRAVDTQSHYTSSHSTKRRELHRSHHAIKNLDFLQKYIPLPRPP